MGSMSIWHWLVVLVIVLLVFGSKKLGNVGSDLGRAIRDFKKGLNEGSAEDKTPAGDKAEPRLRADEDATGAARESVKEPRDGNA